MPTDQPTLAEWQAMSSGELRAHIAAGAIPPIMGGAPEGDDDDDNGGEPKPKPQGEPAGGKETDPDPTAESVKNLENTLRKVRDELKDARDKIKELEPKAKAHDDLTEEQKSELQKAKDEQATLAQTNAELQNQIREANLRSALADTKYGLASPALAALAITNAGVEYDDANQPKDLDDAVKRAVEANPLLEGAAPKPKAPKINGGDGAGGGKETEVELTSDELAAAEAAGMTPEEYADYKSPNPPEPSQ